MSTPFNKFNNFVADCANKVHNLSSDTIMVALSNVAPVATNTGLSQITEIAYTNVSTRALVVTVSSQTGGLYSFVVNPLVLTASGAVGPFRYAVIYNATDPSHRLIGWFDYGSAISMANTNQFTVGFDQTNGILQLQ